MLVSIKCNEFKILRLLFNVAASGQVTWQDVVIFPLDEPLTKFTLK